MDTTVVNTALQIAPLATVVAITIGIVQLIKYADEAGKFARFYPSISFVIGMIVGELVFHLDIPTALVTALSASGTYEIAKRSVMGVIAPSQSATPTEPTDPTLPVPPPMGETANYTNPNNTDTTPKT